MQDTFPTPTCPAREQTRARESGSEGRSAAERARLASLLRWLGHCTMHGGAMKKVEAIIRPHTIDEVRAALDLIAVPGATVVEVRGSAKRADHTSHYRGTEYESDLVPKLVVEVLVDDDDVGDVVDAIIRVVRTGAGGDGKLFVGPVEEVVRIRTGERGVAAI